MIFSIPLVAILTAHQRKMAEILHRKHAESVNDQAVLEELARLRQMVTDQSLVIEELRDQQRLLGRPTVDQSVQQRLNS